MQPLSHCGFRPRTEDIRKAQQELALLNRSIVGLRRMDQGDHYCGQLPSNWRFSCVSDEQCAEEFTQRAYMQVHRERYRFD
jgi:hypothetical protein